MCGGIPFMIASVMKILRKSWGVKCSGLPSVPVIPAPASAPVRRSRMPSAAIGRFSRPTRRWNSSGIGGFQVLLVVVVGDDERDACRSVSRIRAMIADSTSASSGR